MFALLTLREPTIVYLEHWEVMDEYRVNELLFNDIKSKYASILEHLE